MVISLTSHEICPFSHHKWGDRLPPDRAGRGTARASATFTSAASTCSTCCSASLTKTWRCGILALWGQARSHGAGHGTQQLMVNIPWFLMKIPEVETPSWWQCWGKHSHYLQSIARVETCWNTESNVNMALQDGISTALFRSLGEADWMSHHPYDVIAMLWLSIFRKTQRWDIGSMGSLSHKRVLLMS